MIFRGKFSALALILFIGLCACSGGNDAKTQAKRLPLPTDEATSEERSQLDATLTQIEGITRDLGHPQTFRSIPVILTTDDHTYTDHPAGCVSSGGVPQFILVKRVVLENEARISEGQVESTLFRVLLHEIGHCYFSRQHEDAPIFEVGKNIELSVKRGNVGGKIQYPMLDATVMEPQNLTLPIALEKYYVSEILGMGRAKTLADLAAYAPLRYVAE
ncbi:MAG: hypothetical protein ACXVB9_02690 [Bdellovibrionota bacterium]